MVIQVRALLPERSFLRSFILEFRQFVCLVLGREVLVIEPLPVLVADGLVRGERMEIPPGSENEGGTAAVVDVLLRVILWTDPVEPLEQFDVWLYSEISFTEGLEVGEHREAVGANVVRLKPIFV